MVCSKQHRYASEFDSLPISQGNAGRHKCAGCAYEHGHEAGINNKPANYQEIVDSLPDSQAGAVRHKDPEEAYNLGYEAGLKVYNGNRTLLPAE